MLLSPSGSDTLRAVIAERLRLDGRTIVVAGAGGGGIGSEACRAVVEAGGTAVAVDISEEALDPIPVPVTPVVADVSDPAGIERVVAAAGDATGLVTVVGGAALDDMAPALDYTAESWNRLLRHNLDYVLFLSQALAREMVDRGVGGSLVFVSSISSLASQPFIAPYGAAKAAVNSLARTLAVEWGAHDIRVNAIAPGTITTPRGGVDADPAANRRAIPMHRRGAPAEIAAAALFLLSDLASYVSGQVLAVDGGMSVKLAAFGDDNAPVFVPDLADRLSS